MKDARRYVHACHFLVLAHRPKGDPDRLASMGLHLVPTGARASLLPPDDPGHAVRIAEWLLFLPLDWTAHLVQSDPGGAVYLADAAGRFRAQYVPEALCLTLFTRYAPARDGVIIDPSDPRFARAVVEDRSAAPPMSLGPAPAIWTSPERVQALPDDDLSSYRSRLLAIAEAHMDAAWPGWRDPTAYW